MARVGLSGSAVHGMANTPGNNSCGPTKSRMADIWSGPNVVDAKPRQRKTLADLAPMCPYCRQFAELATGARVYPGRPDLAEKPIWLCAPCNAYCGCHPGTKKPLGIPADAATRFARMRLHQNVLDPLWQGAINEIGYEPEDEKARAIIRNVARKRVYAFLAAKMGIRKDDAHTGLFDIEQCRRAWRILREVDYREIRAWAKAKKETPCTPSSPSI